MKVSIHGVRGSIPTSSAETSHFGGHTSCVTVTEKDWMIILDGGSGLQNVNLPDKATVRVDILLTHLHFDHIQGLGFFSPLFDPDKEVHIWGPASATQSLQARLNRFLSPPFFPVHRRDLPCKLSLHDVSNGNFEIGPFKIESQYVIHPGPTVGFRVKAQDAVLAYIPDHEPALGPAGLLTDKKWISGFDLVENANLLVHDGQYTAQEYRDKMGWGHSSMENAIELAFLSGVERLLISHHDPSRTDGQLNEICNGLKDANANHVEFEFAREGTEIELG